MKKKEFEINYYPHREDEKEDYETCVKVCSWGDEKVMKNLVEPNELITSATKIKIKFDYPLNKPTSFEFENEDGFTKKDFFGRVYDGYKSIYETEEKDVGDPGYIPGMYNRQKSEGPFGIWGHYMDDLFIEGVRLEKTENDVPVFSLSMGS